MSDKFFLFVGNPGTGKSTLINGVFGKAVFKAEPSYTGAGVTFQLDTRTIPDVGCFMDTPGLADDKLKKEAAQAITDALKKNGFYRIFFVITETSGRIHPADKATMQLVLKSAEQITHYAVIVNKVKPKWLHKFLSDKDQVKNWTTLLMADLSVKTNEFYFMEDDDNLESEANVEYRAPPAAVKFIMTCPGMEIDRLQVNQVEVDQMAAIEKEHEEKLGAMEKDRTLMMQTMLDQERQLQQNNESAEEAKRFAAQEAAELSRQLREQQSESDHQKDEMYQLQQELLAAQQTEGHSLGRWALGIGTLGVSEIVRAVQ